MTKTNEISTWKAPIRLSKLCGEKVLLTLKDKGELTYF